MAVLTFVGVWKVAQALRKSSLADSVIEDFEQFLLEKPSGMVVAL